MHGSKLIASESSTAIRYERPTNWIEYSRDSVFDLLIRAKVAVQTLTNLPFQKTWFEPLQQMQLKREVAGTSKIEGADFTENELDVALSPEVAYDQLVTRAQKQARAAVDAYRWIDSIEEDRPIDKELILALHRRLVTGCDDDHCEPGALRAKDWNVTFGVPKHRGAPGGKECSNAFDHLLYALNHEYRGHDPLIQALALHYHIAAMHPFQDGNGRTARALEALMLKRADLTDRAFIAMSNYYYDEKRRYLSVLAEVRSARHDLTAFLRFGLEGIELQCQRLKAEIRKQVDKTLFKDMMYVLFNRLESTRKRVIAGRQVAILKVLLDHDELTMSELRRRMIGPYYPQKSLLNSQRAYERDLVGLLNLRAIKVRRTDAGIALSLNLNWPQEITESQFFEKIRSMPRAKTHDFL